MKHESSWQLPDAPSFPPLAQDASADVLIIGCGITGVTAAYLLAKAGRSVILVDKDRLFAGQTGYTTAHISYPTDIRMRDLVKKFGHNHAQAAWDAGLAAADHIRRLICVEEIDCGLRQVPGYLYAAPDADDAEKERLQHDAGLADDMGFDAEYLERCPVTHRPAVRFSNLMKFHPTKYVVALAQAARKLGAQIYEGSEVQEFDDEHRSVRCNGHRISYQHVFIATHVPLQGVAGTLSAMLLQTKLAGYSTYALEAELPMELVPEALWWDTSDPYFYIRTDRVGDTMRTIVGGEDHKTGQAKDTEVCYSTLEKRLREVFPAARVTRRWSGQVVEPVDGLPYIGEYAGQFVATGFAGTGMTFGTLSALMFADHVQGITNPWKDLFHVERKELSSTWSYLKENKDYPYYLTKSLFMGESREPKDLATGEGAILRWQGKKVAASKGTDGKVTVVRAICPHLGCVVGWNNADQTWDCPCHGSRFTAAGQVIAGPAESPLEPVQAAPAKSS